MKLEDLKSKLLNENIHISFLVFECEESYFIPKQYITYYAEKNNLNISYIESVQEISNNTNIFGNDNYLYILIQDKYELEKINYDTVDNCIVICKTSKDIDKKFICKVPKLQKWQVLEYERQVCSGLSTTIYERLYNITQGNINRIDLELAKIKIFPQEIRENIYQSISQSGGYSDLSTTTVFNYTNAIMHKDLTTLIAIQKELQSIDVEGVGILVILNKNIKQLIDVQMSKNSSPEALGMQKNQYYAIKYNCGVFTNTQLIKMFKFLTSLDDKMKSGNLQLSSSQLVAYITLNLLSC